MCATVHICVRRFLFIAHLHSHCEHFCFRTIQNIVKKTKQLTFDQYASAWLVCWFISRLTTAPLYISDRPGISNVHFTADLIQILSHNFFFCKHTRHPDLNDKILNPWLPFFKLFLYQNLTQQQEFNRQGVESKSASFVIGFFDLAILWICDYGGVPASAFFFTNRLSVYSEKLISRSLKTKLEFSVSFGWAGVIVQ